jgi:hypothetical protein
LTTTIGELERAAATRGVLAQGAARLGSLWLRLSCEEASWRDAILAMFRTEPGQHGEVPRGEGVLEVFAWRVDAGETGLVEAPEDALVVQRGDRPGAWVLASDALDAHVFLDEDGEHGATGRAFLRIRDAWARRPVDEGFRVHLSVAMHKTLLLAERVFLHAAGVRLGGRTAVFVGDKGAGKSTLSLTLGAAGGVVLADDHVVLRRNGTRFLAAGCDSHARVTRETEEHLFSGGLEGRVLELAGVRKVEFPVGRHFASDPFREHPIDRLVFPSVRERFRIEPLAKHRALLLLIEATRTSHRFSGPRDYGEYLDYFSDLVDSVETFTLELSPDLTDLARLAAWMRE